jgi:hypothetical protein
MTSAAHPFWLFAEDIQLGGKIWHVWRADAPGGAWLATPHDGNPNMHDCTVARGADRCSLMIALLAVARKAA